jgi:5-methylthioadenosine/S-adenosylhomocysteine deaminase
MLAIAEMIQSGTTTFCDGYFYAGKVARAAMETGIRTVCCLGFFDLDNPRGDPEKIRVHTQTADRFINKLQGASPLVHPALFPHSPYMCSPGTLKEIKRVANEAHISFITHLAETRDEVKTIQDRYGFTSIRHLASLGILDERTVAVHCNWLDEEEIKILAGRGVKVSHNPESGMKLASGLAPVPKMLDCGMTVGLGTDGCASNNDHDMFGEMGTTAKVHKLMTMDPTVMDAKTVLKMATIDGARVLGLDHEIGSIEPGKLADIILLNMDKPRLTPIYNPYSHVVYAASGSDVITSIIHGKVLMKNNQLTTIDLGKVLGDARKLAGVIREYRLP